MAKKKEEIIKVRCQQCKFGGDEYNHMIDCFNEKANPRGFKMGAWAKQCQFYVKKEESKSAN